MDPSGRVKKACQRCRSLKARCPGPSSDTERCARCIKSAGNQACVYEEHKRGRKAGTRLSDPTKALMRVRSALSVLQASGELQPTALERVQAELSEAEARAVASGSRSARPKARGKPKGTRQQQQQDDSSIEIDPDLLRHPSISEEPCVTDDLEHYESDADAAGSSVDARATASPLRPFARGASAASFESIDRPRNGSAGPLGLGAPPVPSVSGRVEDGPPTADGFANDDLYSYHLPALAAAQGRAEGSSTVASSGTYMRPNSAASTSMRAQAHAQAALGRSPYAGSFGRQQGSPAHAPFQGSPKSVGGPSTAPTASRMGPFRSTSPQTDLHPPAGRDLASQLAAPSAPYRQNHLSTLQHQAAASHGRYFAPGLPMSDQHPYPSVYSPTAINSDSGSRAAQQTPSAYAVAPPTAPHQFDELIPLRSSSKSLATLLRPRGFGSACDGGADSIAAIEAAAAAEERAARKDVVRMGLVGEEEARSLFAFFMDKVGGLIYLFDPVLYTHDAVRRSSPLLYSTVLAIALRFTSAPDEKYQRMLAAARDGVLSVLADNLRSEETIMALILQTEFKGIHDEGSYLMLGMAIRIGMDMDIGRPLPHLDERRNRSRTRCWIGLFNADRRFGGCGQVQKPEIMPEDAVIRASVNFHDHPLRLASDTRLVAGTQLRRLLSRYSDLIQTAGNGPAELNMRRVYESASEEVDSWAVFWEGEIVRLGGRDRRGIELAKLHVKLQLAHHWIYRACRFPQSPWIKTPEEWETERRAALAACLGLSVGILNQMLMLPQDEILLYSPDSTHLFYCYGSFLLEKLFRARLLETHVLDPASTQLIFDVIRASADRLDSLTLAPDSVTALHATLLRSLLPEGDPGSSTRSGAGSAARLLVQLPKGPPIPHPNDTPPSASQHQTWSDVPRPVEQQPNGVVDFSSFGNGGGADNVTWEGLDEEALAALATLENSIGTFNWEELSYSPP